MKAFLRTLSQWDDPALLQLMRWTFGLALGVFIALAAFTYLLIGWITDLSPWLRGFAEIGGLLGSLVVAWFTFPALAAAIAGFFSERVILAVEKRYYPHLVPLLEVSPLQSALSAVKLALVALAANVLALPFLIVPPLYIVVAWLLNGWILSREYFDMVACRYLDSKGAAALFRENRGGLTLVGILIAITLTLPLINMVAPILATAFMVHVVENMIERGKKGRLAGSVSALPSQGN